MVPAWQFGLVGVLVVALATDLQSRKIYNWLTFPAMLVGLVLSFALGGMPGLGSSAIGFVVGGVVFLLGFLIGGMGAGDVKLGAAIGAWLGWPVTVTALLYVTFIGGVIAVGAAAVNGNLVKLFKNTYWFMVGLLVPGGKAQVTAVESAAPPIPYGVSLAVGTMLALLFPEPQTLLGLLR